MVRSTALTLVTLVLLISQSNAFADAPLVMAELNPNGTYQQFSVPATVPISGQKAVFLARSKGNISEFVLVGAEAPVGTKIYVEAALYSGSASAAMEKASWFSVPLYISGRKLKSVTIGSKNVDSSGDFDPASCGLTREQVINYIIGYIKSKGKILTPQEVCARYGTAVSTPLIPTPVSSEPGKIDASILLSKDTCLSSSKASYLIRVTMNFDAVDPGVRASGFAVSSGLRRIKYSGKKAATIKPVSEGRFRPKPLVLMAALSGGGVSFSGGSAKFNYGQINVNQWSRGKIRSTKTLNVADYTYYARMLLTRTPLSTSMLKGGKATFELTNGNSVYSVCFELKRKRQSVNGYPK